MPLPEPLCLEALEGSALPLHSALCRVLQPGTIQTANGVRIGEALSRKADSAPDMGEKDGMKGQSTNVGTQALSFGSALFTAVYYFFR